MKELFKVGIDYIRIFIGFILAITILVTFDLYYELKKITKMKYSSSFTHDLNFGEKAEDLINYMFSDGKHIEVKNDRLIHKTGNLFFEYESRGKPSGLATTTAEYWIYRIDELDVSFIFPTKALKQVCRSYYKENLYLKNGGDNNSSKGFLIPLIKLLNDIANAKGNKF